ncbi:LysR family transcriptional regulator [Rhodoferax antarcticus]|uniref:Transcriptional regulator, LysR family n=1 Tax=Rhodoferax antarcticus ANT.BR TaxID=1111071 RepID=A0A1Q8YK26_9BURK|nr:LysR family transcriptional regulator [Rhodoferax antarcticus]APW47714.1 transcriptional regulator [Rhodoferax antarcticus]MCW2312537.1 DNA-binding transcriptional LysR family regulator [Rhodoferax antarcticus]OLP08250.1 Transcriptional regulator, LysR family [Rhodoferax antarcticus ANT.BR]
MSINQPLDNLSDMAVFARVAEVGSFSGAARQLGLTPSAVSRQVARLEDVLRVRLLERTTRKLRLTQAGSAALTRCQAMVAAAREVMALSDTQSATPRGLLRITIPEAFAQQVVHPLMPAFLARYPEVDVQLIITDRTVDLYEEAVDLAIRITDAPPPGLAGRPLMPSPHLVCASPHYLATRGTPAHPHDLAQHSCLYLGADDRDRNWRFQKNGGVVTVRVSGRYVADHSDVRLDGALQHLGIASLPGFTATRALQSGQLVRVLPDWLHLTDYAGTAWLLYPPNRYLAAKLRAWIDFVVAGLTPPLV